MEKITRKQFQRFFEGEYKVIEQDQHGIKVVETSDHKIIKIFRLKRYFSSALFKPYALRFKINAETLKTLEIPSVEVEKLAYCPVEKRYVVVYQKLNGTSLRQTLQQKCHPNVLARLAQFVANLHDKGVYFRSLHFGNIITTDSGDFALIDVADMRILKRSLSPVLRIRNFQHLLRYKEDRDQLEKLGLDHFRSEYLRFARMNRSSTAIFQKSWDWRKLSS